MAATDKPYRNQYKVDIVFGVSCLLLLASTVWMMYDDHVRPFKAVQRKFRDVEEALYVQQMVEKYPEDRLDDVEAKQKEVDEARAAVAAAKKQVPEDWLKKQGLEKARREAEFQDKKANYDSEVSLYNIAVDERDTAADGPHKKKLGEEVAAKKKHIEEMDKELQDIQRRLAENERQTADKLADQKQAEERLGPLEDELRKMTNDFDRLAKLAAQKRWKKGDWFRSLPVIDGFASAYRIQQVTLNDLTIEYGSFKDVPRYDRCTTCHLAIDRATFDPASLRNLDLAARAKAEDRSPDELRKDLEKRHAKAIDFIKKRIYNRDEKLGFEPGDLGSDVPSVSLTEAQVKMYAAHPRLDLFVDSNSPHAVEKFGCTTCHAGQGSATEFTLAAHTPNNTGQKKDWEKEHSWEPFHDWEFPMLPARFVEASCVKCHHQLTDLIRQGSKEEAPKLLKGYNLVKDNGCFGCHEIGGMKAGRDIGPDLRLEPSPALDQLPPDDRARLLADPSNPPGTLRKVGPSLRRLSEKTNEEWARKWINNPRGFRPDTKMPHFYNLSTNSPDVLPGEADNNQKDYPATEIASIAHYLFAESRAYVNGSDRFRQYNLDRLKYLEGFKGDNQLSDKQAKELIEVRRRLEQWKVPTPLAVQVVDADGKVIPQDQIPPPGNENDRAEGRRLFTERGCLACHSHVGTETGAAGVAPVVGEAHFGPNLSRTAAKINGDRGRRWLIQWIVNPNVHNPRTRMPITHLNPKEAGQVADWLLSQEVTDKEYQDWNKEEVPAPTKEMLVNLARVYLKKAPAVNPLRVDEVLENGFTDVKTEAPLMADDADEQVLKGPITEDKLKYYIGKKAVGRLGCFACHEVPGFESAKPVGTPLNDWGKKDPARLAFEDIEAFVKDKYDVVDRLTKPDDPTQPSEAWAKAVEEGKKPYEKFFADALSAHQREGFLNQKVKDPRSYDYHRDVKWDDRLRMPQFKFAHPRREKDESPEEFAARADMEEAQAREAVMTFILGLVAEPIHARYLSNPAGDRMAEVKGRQVLDKFNCAGCHLVRAGVYDVRLNDDSRKLLEDSYRALSKDSFAEDYEGEHGFRSHNAWSASQPLQASHLTVLGADPRQQKIGGRDLLSVRLVDAAQFLSPPRAKGATLIAHGSAGKKATLDDWQEVLQLDGGNEVRIEPSTLISRSDSFGGTFANLMVPYLIKKNPVKYPEESRGESKTARSALPPPLVREGEKAQTDWLFNFLRNPTAVRPITVLRMPKFNMSEEDAQALVNYFAAADKVNNPGIGLNYPYLSVPERQPTYWQDRNREYVDLLAKEQKLDGRVKAYQADLEKQLKDAKDADKAGLEAEIKGLKEALDEKDETKRKDRLAQADLYWVDGYRLLTVSGNNAICMKCHNVGALKASEEQGPPLDLSHSRLRPDWTMRWIANPNRLLTYPTPMPQNFPRGKEQFRELFDAPSLMQVQSLRDVLMNYPKVADLPGNRSYHPATSGGK